MIEVFTSHWRSPLLEDVDAQIVSISRGQPRWSLPFRYRRFNALAPNDEVWSHEDTEGFEAAYLDQLASLGADLILADLGRISGVRPAVLLCWEKPGEWCHRRMLADFLHEQAGVEIRELEPGMLEKRPDAPQPALFDEKEEA